MTGTGNRNAARQAAEPLLKAGLPRHVDASGIRRRAKPPVSVSRILEMTTPFGVTTRDSRDKSTPRPSSSKSDHQYGRWSGNRTRHRMISSHLLYQLSYPSRSLCGGTRNRIAARASRVSASPNPFWPHEGAGTYNNRCQCASGFPALTPAWRWSNSSRRCELRPSESNFAAPAGRCERPQPTRSSHHAPLTDL